MKKKFTLQKKIFLRAFTFIIMLVAVKFSYAQTQGPLNPGIVVSAPVGCLACPGVDWLNPMNAATYNSAYASAQLATYPSCFQATCYYTRDLTCDHFGFTIPTNAIIDGIKAEVAKKASGLSANFAIIDTIVMLMNAGVTTGSNKAASTNWPTANTYISYGNASDLWGALWTPSDINATNFGIVVKALNHASTSSVFVDHVRITVYYHITTGIQQSQTSDGKFFITDDAGNEKVTVSFSLTQSCPKMVMNVYNILGENEFHTVLSDVASGDHTVNILSEKFSPGIYFVEINDGKNVMTKKFAVR